MIYRLLAGVSAVAVVGVLGIGMAHANPTVKNVEDVYDNGNVDIGTVDVDVDSSQTIHDVSGTASNSSFVDIENGNVAIISQNDFYAKNDVSFDDFVDSGGGAGTVTSGVADFGDSAFSQASGQFAVIGSTGFSGNNNLAGNSTGAHVPVGVSTTPAPAPSPEP